jgi:hypothetical protein
MAVEQGDTFVAGWFVAAGATGVIVALTLIRLMLNERLCPLILRTGLYLSLIAIILFATLIYSTVHTLVISITLLFMAVALFDYKYNLTNPKD